MGVQDHDRDLDKEWKTPIWQEPAPAAKIEFAAHPDGPVINARKEGYLQKRAGKSSFRWTIRYFEIQEGKLSYWRPRFKEQLFQPSVPKLALTESRPQPRRVFDLTQLKSVTTTKVKFPYSTRILLRFNESYTNYELELRSEKERDIRAWFVVLIRFTMEHIEVEKQEEEEEMQRGVEEGDAESDTDGP
mmetsp:Transcript_97362/g.270824  ORF Transcript_97362/g.270824 Transcript_97362/m.270824 type:complete len:189 (+) Transcript_97362:47-613(+)